MFSYFSKITQTKCEKTIDITELVEMIKINSQKPKIENIRELRKNGDKNFKKLKRQLPNITPNCTVTKRNLDGELFDKHFQSFSEYIYLDFDVPNPVEYKNYFIEKYGHLASLICYSSSMGGITVLFKIENNITRENYDFIWYCLTELILSEEKVDPNAYGIGQPMFISYDPKIYYNPENSIYLELDSEKCLNQYNSWCYINNRTSNNNISNNASNIILNCALSIIPIKEVLKSIKTSTSINTNNPVLDYMPVDYTSSRFPREIKDGYKHYLYPVMIHILVHLNSNLPLEYIYSYLHFVNEHFASPPMESREFNRLFEHTYNKTQQEGYHFNLLKTKYIHFNPDSDLTGDEKRNIAIDLNAKLRVNTSIKKIQQAKEQLQREGKKITNMAIAKLSGLSRCTVIKHINSDLNDIEKKVQDINEKFEFNSNYHNNIPLDTTGIAPDERSSEKKYNYPIKKFSSSKSNKIDLNKIRNNFIRNTG